MSGLRREPHDFDAWPTDANELIVRMKGWWSLTHWMFDCDVRGVEFVCDDDEQESES